MKYSAANGILYYISGDFMAIPESVRNVPRTVNTVVMDNEKDRPNRYAVREMAGTKNKYVQNGNSQPENGKVIGYFFEGVYVPIIEETVASGPDMLSYEQRYLQNLFLLISLPIF